jgi:hypothetical protein
MPKRTQETVTNAHGETEALELRCLISPIGDSVLGFASTVVIFLVRILIVGDLLSAWERKSQKTRATRLAK